VATGLAIVIGFALGGLAGYAGGLVDRIVLFAADVLMALPWLYLLLSARAMLPLDLGPTRAFQLVVLLLAAVGWARPARLVRGEVRLARQATYVIAARSLGAPAWRIAVRHVLPAAGGVVATQAALLVPQFVLAEVTLSFFGLGVGEPAASWGGLLAAAQRYDVLHGAWWLLPPALALAPLCYIYYALADALQERFGAPRST
jgi:peptide/nickel transport system permease protein